MADRVSGEHTDFSLALGGPLYQLYLRTRLARPPLELVRRRIVVISLISWAPLLLLAVIAGHAFGGVSIPFLSDLGVHTRLLIALPMLIGSELLVQERLMTVVDQFLEREIIRPEDRAQFEAFVNSAMRIRNSTLAEAGILLVSILIGYWAWEQHLVLGASSWYSVTDGSSRRLTAAGMWYALVSLPILRFIWFRWYFRLFVWYRFLWQVRSLRLRLNLFHPDRAGGLGFLANSVFAFAPVLVAQTVILAGVIGDQILYAGAHLPSFKVEILGMVAFLILVVLVPLCFFVVQLNKANRRAKVEFGLLASRYVDDFHRKWIEQDRTAVEPLLGTPDLQSLADLGNSYNVVSRVRLVPFSKDTVFRLVALVISPILPLVLTMIPLEQAIDQIIKLLF